MILRDQLLSTASRFRRLHRTLLRQHTIVTGSVYDFGYWHLSDEVGRPDDVSSLRDSVAKLQKLRSAFFPRREQLSDNR